MLKDYTEQQLIALGAETPKINTSPLPRYCMADQDYGMTIANGRSETMKTARGCSRGYTCAQCPDFRADAMWRQ